MVEVYFKRKWKDNVVIACKCCSYINHILFLANLTTTIKGKYFLKEFQINLIQSHEQI